jgi:hypothetical protein
MTEACGVGFGLELELRSCGAGVSSFLSGVRGNLAEDSAFGFKGGDGTLCYKRIHDPIASDCWTWELNTHQALCRTSSDVNECKGTMMMALHPIQFNSIQFNSRILGEKTELFRTPFIL